jgi:hypothetical protein
MTNRMNGAASEEQCRSHDDEADGFVQHDRLQGDEDE